MIAKVGDPPGDACVYPKGEPPAIVTQDVIRIRPNKKIVDSDCLAFLMNSDAGCLMVDEIAVEATRKRVGLGDLKRCRVVLPSVFEQEDIVSYLKLNLAKLDDLLEKENHLIGLLKERRTALISAAVTGKIDVRNHPAAQAHVGCGDEGTASSKPQDPPHQHRVHKPPLLGFASSPPTYEIIRQFN